MESIVGNAGFYRFTYHIGHCIFNASKQFQTEAMSRKKTILLSLLLSLPVILFVLQQYFQHSPNLKPTGFTLDENVLYMSYAHQYLDQDHTSLFYSNPFDGDPHSPNIYFQPVNFLFAGLMKLGADPGLTFTIFGLLMGFLCILLAFA